MEWIAAHCVHNNYTAKRDYMDSHAQDIKLLLLGNSHMENSFNVHLMGDSAYCLAQSGRAVYYDAYLLERYLPSMVNLKTVIMPLSHEGIAGDKRPYKLAHYDYAINYYKVFGLRPPHFPYNVVATSAWLSGTISPYYFAQRASADSLGYDREDDVFSGLPDEFCQKFKPPSSEGIACYEHYLSEIARQCDERGIRLIVLTTPRTDCYLALYPPDMQGRIHEMVARVQRRYAFEYRDYSYDEEFRNDSLYCNSNHLNHRGGSLLAERVRRDFGL